MMKILRWDEHDHEKYFLELVQTGLAAKNQTDQIVERKYAYFGTKVAWFPLNTIVSIVSHCCCS